jgi:hypothetical protein
LQQALFASLAVMITLIVVQQFAHWTQKDESRLIHHSYSHSAPFAKASALKATDVALSLQPVEDAAAASDESPRQQSWVF